MKPITVCCFSLIFLFTLACAVSTKKEVETMNKVSVFFLSFNDMPYMELKEGATYYDDISTSSDIFDFEDGKSFFKAYQLPVTSSRYQLIISSYLEGEFIDRATILYPTVILLDDNFNVVRKVDGKSFELKPTLPKETWGLPYKYETAINFQSIDNPERYLIVYSAADQRNQQTSLQTMKVIPVQQQEAAGEISLKNEEKPVRHSPIGRIQIELRTEEIAN